MHEAGVAEQILLTVKTHARGRPVESINIRIGKISGVAVDSLDFWLRAYLEEKKTPQTRIEYNVVPVRLRCQCGKEYEVENMAQHCPSCGLYDRTILQGQECTVESIEVNDE